MYNAHAPTIMVTLCCVCRHPIIVLYVAIAVSVLHVLSFLFMHWNVSFKALVSFRKVAQLIDAEYVQVIPHKFSGKAEIVPLEIRQTVRSSTATATQHQPNSRAATAVPPCQSSKHHTRIVWERTASSPRQFKNGSSSLYYQFHR
eukprot:GHUV01048512.1.p1 GENE.GHUV01048512.1~~GHUV01048512.1.p1  ORF type:complete len:145 (+),score=29.08 GHUV01048512.1:189-623(+)